VEARLWTRARRSINPEPCGRGGVSTGVFFIGAMSLPSRKESLFRHGRIYSGHPRLNDIAAEKTWMAGT
jgi:hypothetical protein